MRLWQHAGSVVIPEEGACGCRLDRDPIYEDVYALPCSGHVEFWEKWRGSSTTQ